MPAPELHNAQAVPQDRVRRVGTGQAGPGVGQVVTQVADDVRHGLDRPVDVTGDRVRLNTHPVIMAPARPVGQPGTALRGDGFP